MIGKLKMQWVALDYTEVAKPLTIEQIASDTNECRAAYNEEPEELVMWEHQLDWLAKPYRDRGKRSGYWTLAEEPPNHARGPEIYGIRVRLA